MFRLLRRALPLALAFITFTACAQRADSLMHHLFLMPGVYMAQTQPWNLADMHAVAPGSTLLGRDLSGYQLVRGRSFSDAPTVSGSVAFGLPCQGSTNGSGPLLRIGFDLTSRINSSGELRNIARTPYDTLTSSQTGQSTYIDSVTTNSYRVRHTYQRVALDASLIYLRKLPGRWSVYGGLGAWGGLAFNGETTVDHTVRREQQPSMANADPHSGSDVRNREPVETELIHTTNAFTGAVYLPLGVSWQLGRTNAFWRTLHLTYELRPTLSMGGVPELGSSLQGAVSQNFGLRMDLR